MTYEEAVEYLYTRTPQFQSIGAAAYKPGLDTINDLLESLGNPHMDYPVIHVAGTNGKGSTSHTIAAVLQQAGYKVGLYTSPHLVDFRERMRVDGQMIHPDEVARFVRNYSLSATADRLDPSFFELTTAMAFEWFRREKVDVAVIEVGLGGRLDSTNVVDSQLSVITNISFDHMAQLGDTLEAIAAEKAGIMRPGVPVIIGEPKEKIRAFLIEQARKKGARACTTERMGGMVTFESDESAACLKVNGTPFGDIEFELHGDCQHQNALTVLTALDELKRLGWVIPDDAVREGFSNVCSLTGLMGRWMKLSDTPLTICDTGHNIGGWELLAPQINRLPRPLTMVLGFVADKDLTHILPLLPSDAGYIFTNADIPRALPAAELAAKASEAGIKGIAVPGVGDAYQEALASGSVSVFIGGSTFVVADLLKFLRK